MNRRDAHKAPRLYPAISRRAEAEGAITYWADETGVSNCEIVECGFSPKGRPPVLPVETKRQRVNMISALSSQGKVRFMLYQDTMNQQRLIRFMGRFIRSSGQKVFLVLDNLKVHHGKLVTAWLEKNKEKSEVFFLPPYAPEYNPDEYLNHALKISVHSGNLPNTAEDISHKISVIHAKFVASSLYRFQLFPPPLAFLYLSAEIILLLPKKVCILPDFFDKLGAGITRPNVRVALQQDEIGNIGDGVE